MSKLNQFMGADSPPKSIVNRFSGGGVSIASINAYFAEKEILSGALTANTLKTLLSISGAGALKMLTVYTKDATARTLRLKITIDGVVVFDATSNSITAANSGLVAGCWGCWY